MRIGREAERKWHPADRVLEKLNRPVAGAVVGDYHLEAAIDAALGFERCQAPAEVTKALEC
jgi:hypothetical protein